MKQTKIFPRLFRPAILPLVVAVLTVLLPVPQARGCTSAVASYRGTAVQRPMLWKHRDTGAPGNFIERVPASHDGEFAFVGLFNDGDSLLTECWTGMNEVGFAIMNTASYNLAPDTAAVKDREGIVMALALRRCRTVADFAAMLDTLPRPMGVQANFGVIDANGAAAYFETHDHGYTPYYINVSDDSPKTLLRTNYSFSGNDSTGMGYIRYDNARHLLGASIDSCSLTADDFFNASKSYYHSRLERDPLSEGDSWAVDQDFIPRRISTASIVIQGVAPGQDPSEMTMRVILGYPPVGDEYTVTMDNVPDAVRPVDDGFTSPACNTSNRRKQNVFPISRGSGKHYINLEYLRQQLPAAQ